MSLCFRGFALLAGLGLLIPVGALGASTDSVPHAQPRPRVRISQASRFGDPPPTVVSPLPRPVTPPLANPVVPPLSQPVVSPLANPIAPPLPQPVVPPLSSPVVRPLAQPVAPLPLGPAPGEILPASQPVFASSPLAP